MKAALVALLMASGCGKPARIADPVVPTPPDAGTAAASTDAGVPANRAPYVGMKLRPVTEHGATDPGLPAELESLGDVRMASGARVVPARRDADLVLLLAIDDVVVDAVELAGAAVDSA